VAGGLWGALVWAGQARTHGWFWTWVWRAHSRHAFYARRAFLETPVTLLKQAPAIFVAMAVLLVWGAVRRVRGESTLGAVQLGWALAGAAGAAVACLAFGTQWAFTNAYIPGVFFPLVALGALAGAPFAPRALVPAALAIQLATQLYDPRPYCPTAADRAAGERLLQRIAAAPGDVFIPFHPYYPVMVGKPATLHRMGVMDAPAAGLGRPRGLDEALAGGRFALVIMDTKVQWAEWPTLLGAYEQTGTLELGRDAPRVFSGAETSPRYLLEPRTRDREP
jgi:hypothetical protein